MPLIYVPPENIDSCPTKQVEFWVVGRGKLRNNHYVDIPTYWSDERITDELKEWGALYHKDTSATFGWNKEENFGKRE